MKTKIFTLLIIVLATGLNAQRGPNRKDECLVRNLSFNATTALASNPLSPYLTDDDRTGVIDFQPFSVDQVGGWSAFLTALSGDTSTTYRFIGRKESNLLEGEYLRYQQLYKGIPVIDGGFTIRVIPNDPTAAISNTPFDPFGPCGRLASLSLNVYEDIDVNTTPAVTIGQIQDSLRGTVIEVDSIELKIVNNILGYCDYRLVYEVQYATSEEGALLGYLDAHSGSLLYYSPNFDAMRPGPTEDHGLQIMNDSHNGSVIRLGNNNLRVYDFTGVEYLPNNNNYTESQFQTSLVPQMPMYTPQWTEAFGPKRAFQAFWMADQIIKLYSSELGIDFNFVSIATHPTLEGAGSFRTGTLFNESHYIIFNHENGNSLVEYDIIGHELGHTVIREFFSGLLVEGGSLHEGICDMFGTFIETLIEGSVDWVVGDNIPATVRDLENTARNCFTDIADLQAIHRRSEALGHWFFLCVNGDAATGIPPMDMKEVMLLVQEALPHLAGNPDYPDLMEVTMDLAENIYGSCSSQFLTILRAWEQICVPTGHRMANPAATCLFLTGSHTVCEEDNAVNLCLTGTPGGNLDFGRWTIVGPQSTSYASVRGMTGNTQYGGECITISHIPDYPYYPQTITIQYRHPNYDQVVTRKIIIRDCDQDDPTCEEYYDFLVLENNENAFDAFMAGIEREQSRDHNSARDLTLKIYDIMGNVLTITEEQLKHASFGQPQVVILTYWDKDGRLVKSEKKLIR